MKIPRLLRGLAAYLSDWKNLLSHALVGVALVALPLVLPLPLIGSLGVFVAIICLNLVRMSLDKRRRLAKAAVEPVLDAARGIEAERPEDGRHRRRRSARPRT